VEIAPGLFALIHAEPKGGGFDERTWRQKPPTHYEYTVQFLSERFADSFSAPRYAIRERTENILGYQVTIKSGETQAYAKVSAKRILQAVTLPLLLNTVPLPVKDAPTISVTDLQINPSNPNDARIRIGGPFDIGA